MEEWYVMVIRKTSGVSFAWKYRHKLYDPTCAMETPNIVINQTD